MANEINTNNSLNHRRNSTHSKRASQIHLGDGSHDAIESSPQVVEEDDGARRVVMEEEEATQVVARNRARTCFGKMKSFGSGDSWVGAAMAMRRKLIKYTKFIGPGFMVSVAYIDPGRTISRVPDIDMFCCTDTRTRKLRDRCSRWGLVPFSPALYDSGL
jgi:hypothetical protein